MMELRRVKRNVRKKSAGTKGLGFRGSEEKTSRTWKKQTALALLFSCAAGCSGYSVSCYKDGIRAGENKFMVSTQSYDSSTRGKAVAVANRLLEPCDGDGFPEETGWESAAALQFNTDWRGKNPNPARETEVRLLWTPETLFLRFRAKYHTITVFPDTEPNGRRDKLWDRDVVEAFLQPDRSNLRRYKEFEVSPNGFWIDLDIAPGEKHDLKSGLKRRVRLDEAKKTWTAELAIPMKCLVKRFDRATAWGVNFYRVEGAEEPRFYSAWQPTGTAVPNFHVPEAFGELVFAP